MASGVACAYHDHMPDEPAEDIEDEADESDDFVAVGRRRRPNDGRLRDPMLTDGQQRFPWWLPLPGIALAGTWAAYSNATGSSAFLDTLLWPGAPIFVVTTLTTYFGWRLDLD